MKAEIRRQCARGIRYITLSPDAFICHQSFIKCQSRSKWICVLHPHLPAKNNLTLGGSAALQDRKHEFTKCKVLRNHLFKSAHYSALHWNTQCQCFFSTSSIFFYHYVNLLPANYATASESELLYLSIEEHGENLNPVFRDILYAASYKRREYITFSMLVKLGSSWSIKCQ